MIGETPILTFVMLLMILGFVSFTAGHLVTSLRRIEAYYKQAAAIEEQRLQKLNQLHDTSSRVMEREDMPPIPKFGEKNWDWNKWHKTMQCTHPKGCQKCGWCGFNADIHGDICNEIK